MSQKRSGYAQLLVCDLYSIMVAVQCTAASGLQQESSVQKQLSRC